MKLMKWIAVFFLMALPLGAAERVWPVLEVEGAAYQNVRLMKQEPDGIRIMHEGGAAKIAYEKLPTALRAELGFDEAAAAAHREEQARAEKEAAAAAREKRASRQAQAKEADRIRKLEFRHVAVQVAGVLPNGDLICYRYQEGGAVGETGRVFNALRRPYDRVTHVQGGAEYDRLMYVTGVKGSWAEGDILRGKAARAGSKEIDGRVLPWWVSKPD